MHYLSVMQCLGVYSIFWCSYIVWVLMQWSGVFANVQVLMECLSVDAMFVCGYINWVMMQYSVVVALFICRCYIRVMMQCLGVNAMFEYSTMFEC